MNQRQTDILKDLDDLRRRSRFSPEAWIATDEAGESVELTPADESRILDEFERDRREIEATPGHLAAALRAYQSEEDPETRREILRRASTWATAFEDYRHARPLNAPETWPGVTPDDLDGLDVPQEPEPTQEPERILDPSGLRALIGNDAIFEAWIERVREITSKGERHASPLFIETIAALDAANIKLNFATYDGDLRKAVERAAGEKITPSAWGRIKNLIIAEERDGLRTTGKGTIIKDNNYKDKLTKAKGRYLTALDKGLH